jgi:hypothetical protein
VINTLAYYVTALSTTAKVLLIIGTMSVSDREKQIFIENTDKSQTVSTGKY